MTGVISNPAGINPPGGRTVAQSKVFTTLDAQYIVGGTLAIAAGECVSINSSLEAVRGTTAVGRTLVTGIAATDAAVGEVVQVTHLGLVTGVKADTGVLAGDLLMRSATNAGNVNTAVAPGVGIATSVLGVALTAESGNRISAFICPSGARATG